MLHIAICDDDSAAVQSNRSIAEDCLKQCGSAGEIAAYTHSDNLLYDITEDGFFFDLILLDIEMPGSTGMELAGKIRPFLPNVKIIFITSHVEYAIDAFELSIFRYVPKNDIARRLPGAICDAIRLIELEEGKFYTIQTNSRLEKIPYKEILFLSRDGKNTSITTAGGVAKVRKSLQQVYEELAAEEFIFIDRGCIVNMIHVMQVKEGMAVLKNGATLPISRSHLQEVKAQINAYWGHTYDGRVSAALRHIDRGGACFSGSDSRSPATVPKKARSKKHRGRAGRGAGPHGLAVPAPCAGFLPNGSGGGSDCRMRPPAARGRAENGPVCRYLL